MKQQEMTRREYNPAQDILGLRNAISGMFDDFFSGRPLMASQRYADVGMGWAPAVNIREDQNEIVVYAALPGVEKGDVDLEVKDSTLVLTGKTKPLAGENEDWVRQEVPYGQFYRAFSLSSDVDASRVNATFKNGVLEIHLPKAEEAKPRKVQING